MAEELFQGQGGVSWWNSPRNLLLSSSPCSGWPPAHELITTLRSSDNETMPINYSSSDHWNNQDLLLSDSGRRSEEDYSNFLLPEIPMSSASYSFLQTLFDTDISQQYSSSSSLHNNQTPNTNYPPALNSNGLNANSTDHSHEFQLPSISLTNQNQLHMNIHNTAAAAAAAKQQREQGKDDLAAVVVKKASNEEPAAFKRPRIETPSPLPTFKVRKEKLGDRITALQQMVSPFGKTDTASVLHEAIDYIKFLHDQVNALSTPYLKYGSPPVQRQQGGKLGKDEQGLTKDLKTRGLCLVPISSTFPVAAETTTDFWTPTIFDRSFRS